MTEFNLSFILKIIKQFKKKIITITLSIMAITVIFSFIMPYTYSAEAILMPPKKDKGSGGLSGFLQSFSGGGLSLGSMGKSNESKLYAAMLASRSVAEYTIRQNNLDSSKYFDDIEHYKIVKQLREELTANVGKNGLIQIEFSLKTPFFAGDTEKKEVALLASEIVNSSIEGLDSILRTQSMNSAQLLQKYVENELARYYAKLDSVEIELEHYQTKHNVLEIEEQYKAMMKQNVEAGIEWGKAEAEFVVAQAEFSPEAPQYKVAKEKFDAVQRQYSSIQTGGLTDSDRFSISLEKIPSVARLYGSLLKRQKIVQEVIVYLEAQRHQEAIAANKNVPTVEVLDRAIAPEKQSAPSKKMMLLLSTILGGLIAVLYVFFDLTRKGYKFEETADNN
jgi:uncharacterized protein involved in exopolysaccharide biosynthesis